MTAADFKRVEPCGSLVGTLRVPGDKSISQRAAILSALSKGRSEIEGYLESEDCLNTLQACADMGAVVSREGGVIHVDGCAGVLKQPEKDLDLGNSGTGMRLLSGVVATQSLDATLVGDASLSTRPMGRVADPLMSMGARIELMDGHAPMRIQGGGLHGIRYDMPMASAQVKSCILLAGLYATGVTQVIEPKPCRDHTERMLAALGVPIDVDGATVSLVGDPERAQPFEGRRWVVPGDFSSAAYWFVAAAMSPGARVQVLGVGLNPD